MSEPFLGEIRIVGFNFAPNGWAECAGQIVSIAQNTALFALLGTTYGGDGRTTFALPDYRGRIGVGIAQGPGLSEYFQGEVTGEEAHQLTVAEIPSHTHGFRGSSSAATTTNPHHGVYAKTSVGGSPAHLYAGSSTDFAEGIFVNVAGNSLPHENRQPFLALLYIIAMQGIFPSRS